MMNYDNQEFFDDCCWREYLFYSFVNVIYIYIYILMIVVGGNTFLNSFVEVI